MMEKHVSMTRVGANLDVLVLSSLTVGIGCLLDNGDLNIIYDVYWFRIRRLGRGREPWDRSCHAELG